RRLAIPVSIMPDIPHDLLALDFIAEVGISMVLPNPKICDNYRSGPCRETLAPEDRTGLVYLDKISPGHLNGQRVIPRTIGRLGVHQLISSIEEPIIIDIPVQINGHIANSWFASAEVSIPIEVIPDRIPDGSSLRRLVAPVGIIEVLANPQTDGERSG